MCVKRRCGLAPSAPLTLVPKVRFVSYDYYREGMFDLIQYSHLFCFVSMSKRVFFFSSSPQRAGEFNFVIWLIFEIGLFWISMPISMPELLIHVFLTWSTHQQWREWNVREGELVWTESVCVSKGGRGSRASKK